MNNSNLAEKQITFASIIKEKKLPIYLGLYEDDALMASMNKALLNEDFDAAIIFRDELERRGKLKTSN